MLCQISVNYYYCMLSTYWVLSTLLLVTCQAEPLIDETQVQDTMVTCFDIVTYFRLYSISAPSITSLEVTRLNRATFNLSVSLAYTGGGAITHFRVSFRNTGTTSWDSLEDIPATPSPDSSLVWNGVVSRDEFAAYSQVEFLLSVINEHGFESNTSHTVCKFVCNLIVPHFSC